MIFPEGVRSKIVHFSTFEFLDDSGLCAFSPNVLFKMRIMTGTANLGRLKMSELVSVKCYTLKKIGWTNRFFACSSKPSSVTWPSYVGLTDTIAVTNSPRRSSGTPTAAASRIRGSAYNAFSTVTESYIYRQRFLQIKPPSVSYLQYSPPRE